MATTLHSVQQAMDRCGMKNQRAAEKNIERAIRFGKTAGDYTSWEQSYLRDEGHSGCTAIAYNGFCYIINDVGRCVTIHSLPGWFGKKKWFDGKERIRNYKKYCQLNHSKLTEND